MRVGEMSYFAEEGIYGLGQAGLLNVAVTLDGKPVAGVDIEVLFANNTSESGKTGPGGLFTAPYGEQQQGNAIVRLLTTPPGAMDIGEDANRQIALPAAGPSTMAFALVTKDGGGAAKKGIPIPAIVGGVAILGILGYAFFKK